MGSKFISVVFLALASAAASAQVAAPSAPPRNVGPGQSSVSTERRSAALGKLIEGQRHYRNLLRSRGQSARSLNGERAKEAFRAAVALDPAMAEAYTALAEITLMVPPGDIDEAMRYADSALAVDSDNFGSNRIKARLATIKSGLNDGNRNAEFEGQAVDSWKKVASLDPRNAEAWAFLSEFHRVAGRDADRVEALRKWLSAAAPVETRFYQTVMGNQSDLSPEGAALPLGEALLEMGRPNEAVDVLNNAVADEPDNAEAIELFKQALDLSDSKAAAGAVQTLEQVVFSNSENTAAIVLLARLKLRAGRTDDAVKLLTQSAARLRDAQPDAAAALRAAEGDVLLEAGRIDDALRSYDGALQARGVLKGVLVSDFEREFFVEILQKKINALKVSDRFAEVLRLLLDARVYLKESDPVFEREQIALLKETGKREEALQRARAAKAKNPTEQFFIREEATVLNELGKTDDAVRLMKSLIGKPSASFNDFSNWLFVSSLYVSARRPKEALVAVGEAVRLAKTPEERQIADVSMAYAQQRGGDFTGAEVTLRSVLQTVPGNPFALNNLGYLLAERGERLDEAASMIFRAVKTDPTNASFLDSLGWLYFKMGKYETSRDYLMRALRLNPTSSAILVHLGDVFEKLGDNESARTYRRRAVRLASDKQQIEEINKKLGAVAR